MSKRVLFCYPWPLHEAIGSRVVLLAYARAFVRAGMTVHCFAPQPRRIERASNGLHLGVFDRLFTPPQASRTMSALLEAAGAGCTDPHLPTQHGCDPASMVAAATIASSGGYSLVGVHYARWHGIRPLLPPSVPAVIFTHELDAIVASQESLVFGTPPPAYTLAMEADRLSAFDVITTVGADDARELLQVAPDLVVRPFNVAVQPVTPVPVKPASDGVLLLMSSSATFHELSLAWFLEHAWPSIVRTHPSVRLMLAGHICDTAKRFGADRDGRIEILGLVDDPEPVFARADVFLAPYYFGGGIKLKILEALAHGLPVVTTTPGLSNLAVDPGRDLLVGDDGISFAESVVRLLRDAPLRERMHDRGLRYVRAHHSDDSADNALAAIFDAVTAVRRTSPVPAQSKAGVPDSFVRHLHRTLAASSERPTQGPADASPLAYLVDQLRALLPWTIQRAQDAGIRRIAVYGAGSHTRLLLPMWAALGGPRPEVVIVSASTSERECCGLPVVAIDGFDPSSVDAIVLSSKGFEREMADTCRVRFPHVPVLPIWSPDATSPQRRVPPTQSRIPTGESHAAPLHR